MQKNTTKSQINSALPIGNMNVEKLRKIKKSSHNTKRLLDWKLNYNLTEKFLTH